MSRMDPAVEHYSFAFEDASDGRRLLRIVGGVITESSISNVFSRSEFAKDGDDAHCTTHVVSYHADLDGGLALDVVASVARTEAASISFSGGAGKKGDAFRTASYRAGACPS